MARTALLREMTGLKPLKPHQSMKTGVGGKLVLSKEPKKALETKEVIEAQLSTEVIVESSKDELPPVNTSTESEIKVEVETQPVQVPKVPRREFNFSKKPANKALAKKKKETSTDS